MQKAEFELNLSRSSSGRARSRGLRSPHSKRLGSLEPTVCSLGWFYADTDLRPDSPPLGRPRRPQLCPATDGAHRARGFAADVTGKVSNSGARPPETGFTLSCVTERSASLLRRFLPLSSTRGRHAPHAAFGSRCTLPPLTRHRTPLLVHLPATYHIYRELYVCAHRGV